MTGLKKGTTQHLDDDESRKTVRNNLRILSDDVTDYIMALTAPHNAMVEMSEHQLRTIRSDLDSVSESKGNIALDELVSTITCFYGTIKIGTRVENMIAKILNEVYKSAMALNIQVNINKADRTMDTRAKLRNEGVKL